MRPAFKFAKTSNTAGVRSSTSDPVDEHVTHSSCAVTITDLFMAAGKARQRTGQVVAHARHSQVISMLRPHTAPLANWSMGTATEKSDGWMAWPQAPIKPLGS